ncbi:MAG: hypothetical protein OQK82_03450, partial [Candidatus Pacearchaeota archaeon]|nr:hypothetical protein [Candidatus Pacearchaeota archaeon]
MKIQRVLLIISILLLIIPFIISIPNGLIKINLFSDYLGLITGLAGVLITITVFLIQNTTQDYSSQLIRMTFFKDKYFAFILSYIMISLSFFLFGLSFEVPDRIKFLGFFVSIGLIFNFTSLLISSSYHMNLLNIIKEIEYKSIKYISNKAKPRILPLIGKIKLQDYSEKQIIDYLVPLFDTLKKSISLNQNDVSSQCLKSIDKILKTYLKKTSDFKSVEDKLLARIGDEISFLINESTKYENQKFMEKLAFFIGNLGKYTLIYRQPIGDINDHATPFTSLLVTLFNKSYRFDRTITSHIVIKEISKIINICIHKEFYRSGLKYNFHMEEIIKFCLENSNGWSARLISSLVHEYKKLINECIIVSYKKNISLDLFETFFQKILMIVKNSKDLFSSWDFSIIRNSAFNLHSILVFAMKTHPDLPQYKEIPKKIFMPFIESYYRLHKEIIENLNIDIDFMFLNFFSEFAFFTQYFNKENFPLIEKNEQMFQSLLERLKYEYLKSEHGDIPTRFYTCIEDYFSILIYSKGKELTEKQINIMIDFYNEIESINSPRLKNKIYGLLKTIGAFMENEPEFKLIQDKITLAI